MVPGETLSFGPFNFEPHTGRLTKRKYKVIDASEALLQLDGILSTPRFVRADSLSRFLRYAVERTVHGQTDQLKELSVGTEVFGRAADFDPRIDPIVRVQARELRTRL